jgi:hypothetical protein
VNKRGITRSRASLVMSTDRRKRWSHLCLIVLVIAAACGGVNVVGDAQSVDDAQPDADHPPAMRTITVQRGHGGSGTVTSSTGGIACGATCATSVADGTAMVLTAAPDTSSVFAGWSGPCTGTSLTCSFMVSGDVAVVAELDVKR